MEFKRENPDCSFTVPDTVTVRQQMAYFSLATLRPDADLWERLWDGARTMIQDWNCPLFPDASANLDSVSNPQITAVLIWASARVQGHIAGLELVPKNS